MFEAVITPAVARKGGAGTLRPLGWSEIVARLAATRDLRALFARPSLPAASFAEQAQGWHHAGGGEPRVNLDGLSAGKTPAAIRVATVEEAAKGDQGTQ